LETQVEWLVHVKDRAACVFQQQETGLELRVMYAYEGSSLALETAQVEPQANSYRVCVYAVRLIVPAKR
jgi:hypothetical protein